MPIGIYKRGRPHCYTHWQLKFLKRNRKLPQRRLWELFNEKYHTDISLKAICAKRKYMGLKTGRTGCFKKGSISWNKGKKLKWVPNSGNFQKGNIPLNHMPVGSETLTTGDEYVNVKIAEPNRWRMKHVLVWERYRGKIPKGMCLLFKDSDRQNCRVGNLQLISRYLNLRLNHHGYAAAPKKLKKSIMLMAQLDIQIFKRHGPQWRLRRCKWAPHKCTECGKAIHIGQYYFDANNGLRIHTRHRKKL